MAAARESSRAHHGRVPEYRKPRWVPESRCRCQDAVPLSGGRRGARLSAGEPGLQSLARGYSQAVAAIVQLVVSVALDLDPVDLVDGRELEQFLPERAVADGRPFEFRQPFPANVRCAREDSNLRPSA